MPKVKNSKNKNNFDHRLDVLANICAVILPLTSADQLYLIFIKKQVVGVSVPTWFLYGLLTIPIFIYNIRQKDRPMIILNGLWIIVDWLICFGAFIYS